MVVSLKGLIKPVSRMSSSAEIKQQIESFIVNKNLQPGDKLPGERELAVMFSVGRPIIREALSALNALNLVEIHHGKGVFVKKFSFEDYIASLNRDIQMMLFSENISIQEMWETRILIEPSICALASQKATKENLEDLKSCIQKCGKASDFPRMAAVFHRKIAECTGNKIIVFIISSLLTLRKKTRLNVMQREQYQAETLKFHRQIFSAIQNRDAHTAQKLMLNHLRKAERHYSECCDS